MDMPSRGEMVEGKLWDYDFTLSANQDVTDPCGFGTAEPSLSQLLGSSCDFEVPFLLDHQPQPAFNFPSIHEEFEHERGFVENQQNLQNEQSYMVQNHVGSSQEGGAVIKGLAPKPFMVDGHGSFFEDNAMMGYIPTLNEENAMVGSISTLAEPEGDKVIEEIPPNSSTVRAYASSIQETGFMVFNPSFVGQDVMMEDELASYSSVVDDLFPLSEEMFREFMEEPNLVHDHAVFSNEGHVIMEATTFQGHAISHEQHDVVEKGLVNVPGPRPNLTFRKGKKLRVRWTPALHRSFVSAVKELGGSESATPERIKSVMNVPGLTRHHVKSHLQKYRDRKLSLVDNVDKSERARRASVSKVLNFSSKSLSSYINPVPVPSNCPSSLVITEQGNLKGKEEEKANAKDKGKGKAKAKS